jgi:hypothetical protein
MLRLRRRHCYRHHYHHNHHNQNKPQIYFYRQIRRRLSCRYNLAFLQKNRSLTRRFLLPAEISLSFMVLGSYVIILDADT